MISFTKKQRLLLVAFAIFYFLLFLLYRYRSARDPGSYFFQPTEGYRPLHSLRRIDESLEYLSAFNQSVLDPESSPRKSAVADEMASICVGAVTVKRPIQQNIDTTIASLLDNLSPEERSTLTIHVLFALSSPSEHPDFNYPWVSNVIDRVLTYEQVGVPVASIEKLEKTNDVARKSLVDYRSVLKSCYDDTNAPWILMLEDDVVAQRTWYRHTMESLQTIESWKGRGSIKDWIYVRLFYTEKFLGWNSEDWPIYTVCSVGLVSMVAFTGVMGRRAVRPMQGILTNSFLAVVCLVYVPLIIVLFFLAGRVTMLPMNPGVHLMNGHGCCSQALLFPRASVPPLIDYLEQLRLTKPKPIDSAVETLAMFLELDRLAIVPSQMQHVGAASYKENRQQYQLHGPHQVQGAHGVWSMGFEEAYDE